MLSKRTKYGIKAMVYLARKGQHDPVNIAEISENENISRKFLESILLTLKKNGILGSKKENLEVIIYLKNLQKLKCHPYYEF